MEKKVKKWSSDVRASLNMLLKAFALEAWLSKYERDDDFNPASSTGPIWSIDELLSLVDADGERERFLTHALTYGPSAGTETLRAAIAQMQEVSAECVQIVTSEHVGIALCRQSNFLRG